jgi:hypothetical protein
VQTGPLPAYVTVLPRDARITIAASLAGLLSCVAFYWLELRPRELAKLGEHALAHIEDIIATRAGIEELRLVAKAERPERRFLGTYRQAIRALDVGIGLAFLSGTVLALVHLL